MSDSTIGIKIADGSYYPVLEHGFTGRKRLTLTTVKDNQEKVKIDLYRGNGSALSEARYLGSLVIENIPPAPQGEPEIELVIGIDQDGQLSAEACDRSTGECQTFDTLPEKDTIGEPEFALTGGTQEDFGMEEPPLTGEDYPVSDMDREKERLHGKGPNILFLVLFVLLGLALVTAIAYFVYRSIQGPQIPPLSTAASASATTQPAATPPAATAGTAKKPAATGEVTYRIKKGDTLWDISATYYRNPWLYPKLAKANSISNPDLIFAGTRIIIPAN